MQIDPDHLIDEDGFDCEIIYSERNEDKPWFYNYWLADIVEEWLKENQIDYDFMGDEHYGCEIGFKTQSDLIAFKLMWIC